MGRRYYLAGMAPKPAKKALFEHALALPEGDRADLAHRLLGSLDPTPYDDPKQVEAEWLEVAERRLREVESGKVKPVPWETVRARIATKLKSNRRATRRSS